MPAELPRDLQNPVVVSVINNHIADSKSSSNIPPNQTSLGSRGNRNNWDSVYGLKNLLFCHHLQSYTGCFSYNSLAQNFVFFKKKSYCLLVVKVLLNI
jgi:hypothetical protein